MNYVKSIVPHACFYIDSPLKSTLEGFETLAYGSETPLGRELAHEDLERLWKQKNDNFYILPCLSVRSGLDLFLSVKSYPPGSEIIMSSINIPTVVQIVHHHGLIIRSCDVSIEALTPSLGHFTSLINERTVAVLLAHIYGKRFDMNPFIEICKKHSLIMLEDCAEAFAGLNYKGHKESDIVFFSFGVIKIATSFGGAITKIKNRDLFESMVKVHGTYPIQSKSEYAYKLTKYSFVTFCFNTPWVFRCGTSAFHAAGIDHKEVFVPLLRGFPKNLICNIRKRPCISLLNNLTFKLSTFDEEGHKISKAKGDYVASRLPFQAISVGQKAYVVNYWLFPILVEQPENVVKKLNSLGVDATRSTTQLFYIKDDLVPDCQDECKREECSATLQSRFLIDHVVYLPVHKLVSYEELDKVIFALRRSLIEVGCKRLKFPPVHH